MADIYYQGALKRESFHATNVTWISPKEKNSILLQVLHLNRTQSEPPSGSFVCGLKETQDVCSLFHNQSFFFNSTKSCTVEVLSVHTTNERFRWGIVGRLCGRWGRLRICGGDLWPLVGGTRRRRVKPCWRAGGPGSIQQRLGEDTSESKQTRMWLFCRNEVKSEVGS